MAPDEFTLLGDALWLDFVNSARGRTRSPLDRFPDPAAWSRWTALQHLDADAAAVPLAQILEFRARLTELADALAEDRQPPAGAIAALNEHLARGQGHQRLTRVGGEWRLGFAAARPPTPLEAVARSAAATLVDTATVVRRCAADPCSLLFTDQAHDGVRRLCDVAVCGRHARIERRRGLHR
jgi:predicted RNA-binding Zn ribbon-like protein